MLQGLAFCKCLWQDAGVRKWSRILFALVALAVVGGIGWLGLRPNEPSYKGKRLSVWLEVYDANATMLSHYQVNQLEADEAVRHIGTNAIPTLLRRLRAKDSPLALGMAALAEKQHIFKFKPAWVLQGEGLFGFEALGADGKYAVPELIRMYEQDHSFESLSFISASLASIGPEAAQAVPALARSLGDTNMGYRVPVITALLMIHSHPEITVPALANCLSDQDAETRRSAADAIGVFGVDAESAVPDLIKSLRDTNGKVREAAEQALSMIDPEALYKAWVKLKLEELR